MATETGVDDQLRSRSLRALGWEFGSKTVSQGILFLVTLFLARILSPYEFGVIAIAMAFIGIGQILVDLGMGAALIQRKRLEPAHATSALVFNAFCGALLSLTITGFSGVIGRVFETPELGSILRALSVIFLIHALNVVQLAILRKSLNYGLIARIDVVAAVTGGVVGVSAALLGAGVWALVAQMIAISLMTTVLTWLLSTWRPTGKPSLKSFQQLWAFGSRIFYSHLLDVLFTRLDILIIGKLYSPAALGHYERAKATSQFVVQNSSITLMNVLFPVLSQIQGDRARTQAVVLAGTRVLSFLTFMIIGALFLVSSDLILLLYGPDWSMAAEIFNVLVISGFGYPFSALLLNVLAARGRSDKFLRIEIIKKLVLAINLAILAIFGINSFLYALIAQSAFAVWLAARSVAAELEISATALVRPILVQSVIAVGCVLLVWLTDSTVDVAANRFVKVFLMVGLFSFLYVLVCALLQTDSHRSLWKQLRPSVSG